ncbi:uncharacterized protein LOC111399443 isoform X1 [Olea europaea var. sylvestris]|uniref:uncharacterized protein LOC111399443 isoform X1 n=1 Tax=Olea europaea var. sylvestris TaxID=158386 RepID=UPI000C1D0960|nr:uncharacterized protein LOC111399443 isoform X1 [Olea europaea var. sylvestris]XP_022882517.1 uncharacterized protein LOC111399443 isoform X1 [Olea europaea var. sylvestris]
MAHRKANKPKEIRHQVDWDYLCDYWESERFQKRSKVVVDNRSRQEFTHFSGSISFIQWQAMGDNVTGRPDRIQLWKNTHYKDTKGWIHPMAEEKYKEMVDIQTTQ